MDVTWLRILWGTLLAWRMLLQKHNWNITRTFRQGLGRILAVNRMWEGIHPAYPSESSLAYAWRWIEALYVFSVWWNIGSCGQHGGGHIRDHDRDAVEGECDQGGSEDRAASYQLRAWPVEPSDFICSELQYVLNNFRFYAQTASQATWLILIFIWRNILSTFTEYVGEICFVFIHSFKRM